MDKSLFRLSDNEKADILFDLINPNFNEEGNWELNYMIKEVYDDYALAIGRTGFIRAYYTKDGDTVTLGETVPVKIIDVTESEYTALETMKSIGGTYENLQTAYNSNIEKINQLESQKAEFEQKENDFNEMKNNFEKEKEELTTSLTSKDEEIAQFNTKIQELEAEKVELNQKISDITSENTVLSDFKKNAETAQKENLLSKYEEYLSEESINNFKKIMNDLSVEDFKKEVCTSAVENSPSIFSHKNDEPEMFFKSNGSSSKFVGGGAIALLNKRKNGGNK